MTIFESIKYLCVFQILILMAGACDLNEELLDSPTPSNYILSEEDIEPVIRGIYENSFDPTLRVHTFNLLYPLADNMWSDSPWLQPRSEKTSGYNSGYNSIWINWRNWYWGIRDANHLMRDIKDLEIDPDYKDQVNGECLFMRGFCHFYLTRMFGEVPLRTTPVDINSELYMSRSSYKEIYTQIIDDFEAAAQLLPSRSEQASNRRAHANKGAAQAMLAEASLTYANMTGEDLYYQKAIQYADSVINSGEYILMPDFGDLWDLSKELETYDEVIFRSVQEGDDKGHGVGLPKFFNPNNLSGTCCGGSPGNEWIKVQPWFYNLYSTDEYNGDYRIEKSFHSRYEHRNSGKECFVYPLLPETPDYADARNSPYVSKFQDPNGFDFWGHGNDIYIIRLAEIYLIKAEAENELHGPTEAAYAAFNKVRERARLADGSPREKPADLEAGLTRDEFRMKLFHERGLELLAEGKRWFDLKRMKCADGRSMYEYMYDDYLPELPQGLPAWNAVEGKWDGGVTYPKSLFMDAYGNRLQVDIKKYMLVPIPDMEMTANPNMTQNPGW